MTWGFLAVETMKKITILNWALASLNGGSFEITMIVHLS